MDSKQLYEKLGTEFKDFVPIADILSIIDKTNGLTAKDLFNMFNHIKLEWKGDVSSTRLSVPTSLRHNGLYISYNDGNGIITEYYIGSSMNAISDTFWQKDNYWLNTSQAAGLADEEDITERNGKLSFNDNQYKPASFSGLGRKILRKNLTEVGTSVKNVLTQEMINEANTIYEIKYDFDLNGQEIVISEGCVLDFQGGSLKNGTIKGSILNEYLKPEWFGAKGDGITDDSEALTLTFKIAVSNSISVIRLSCKYYIEKTVYIDRKTDDANHHKYLNVEGGEFLIGTDVGFDTNLSSSHLIKFNNVNFTGKDLTESSILFTWHIIRLNFIGCHFDKVNYGVINEEGSYYQSLYFNNCRVSRIPSVFIGADKDFTGSAMYDISFINVLAEASKDGTFFDYNAQYAATNIRFIACCLEGLGTAIKANAINQLLILGCYFEGNSQYDILFYKGHEGGSSSTSDGVTIESNSFYPNREDNPCGVYWNARCRYGRASNNLATSYKIHKINSLKENNVDLSGEYFFTVQGESTTEPYYKGIGRMGKVQFGNPKESTTASQYRAYNKGEISFNPNPTDVSGIGWICEEQGSWELSKWRAFGQLLPENTIIPKDGDLNNYKERGTFRTYSQAQAYEYNMINAPVQASGILEVVKAENNVIQRFNMWTVNPTGQSVDIMTWERQYNATIPKWSGWILTSHNFHYLLSEVANKWLESYPKINNGTYIYCSDLKKPLFKDGDKWLDHNGNPMNTPRGGVFANRPISTNDNNIQLGTQYFCTDRKTDEGNINGIMIYHKGNDVWVDALGRIVS